MYIDFDIPLPNKKLPDVLSDIIDELETAYKDNRYFDFHVSMEGLEPFVKTAIMDNRITFEEGMNIFKRYGIYMYQFS